jgi:hypothetical protein
VAGLNTLDFLVRNEPFSGEVNPMGLRVELIGTANPIPEPATNLLLLITGILAMNSRRRAAVP